MIKFFRHIRLNLLSEGKTGKYFKYAIGEVVLVVIGILIALAVNNWNEESKEIKKERQLLLDLKTTLHDDLKLLDQKYEPRLNLKRDGVEYLKTAVFYNQESSKDSLKYYQSKSSIDVIFRYDKGPYDALKSSGYEVIKNSELRKTIIHTYEVRLPDLTQAINGFTEEASSSVRIYKNDLFKEVIVKNDKGGLEIYSKIKVDNFIQHPSLISLLAIEQDKYENYVKQMTIVKATIKNLIIQIEEEIQK